MVLTVDNTIESLYASVSARTFYGLAGSLYVTVVLWWPTVWRDPIYTPRLARMAGHELRLADGTSPKNDDERALAIFWAWEHRQFVETRWVVGPFLACAALTGLVGNKPFSR